MLATLDDLMKIDGVVAVSEFTLDGKLVDHRAKENVIPEMRAIGAEVLAPVNIMFETLGQEFMRYSDMKWSPLRGWACSGGNWTVAVGGTRAVFVETAKADFSKLFKALVSRPMIDMSQD